MIERAWNDGDLAAIDELVHAEYVRHTVSGEVRGPAGFKERIMAIRSAFPDFRSTLEESIREGDRYAARFTNRGTHAGEFFGIAPTGRSVEFTDAVVVHLRDGKLYEEWEFLDSTSLLAQLTPVSAEQGR